MSAVSGKYRLEQRLGGGGMAEVFLAHAVGAEGFSRKVAIKRVLPGYSDNEAFARMFVAEAQITSQLVHPNIVSVLDFDRDPQNRLFLVMELVEGKDLDGLASTGLLPFPVVIFVIAEILRGLGHAHDLPVGNQSRGVVHRDISPHNVLLSWLGAVKVSDFGIAKARAASAATASEFIKGKPAYMSPEQANGQGLDGRSDLFAVGIMLWEMLVGRRLFVAEDTRATLAAVLFGQIPRPRSLRGDVPKDLERVVMKLLERDLPLRYATAEQALHELLECADAPKAGREMLVATLAERFPDQAPIRQSVARTSRPPEAASPRLAYEATAAGPPHQTPPELGHASTRPAAAVSIGSLRNAPTGTIDPAQRPRRRRGSVVLILVAVAIACGAIAFGIAAGLSGGSGSGSAIAGSGSGSQIAVAPPPDSARVEPPPPPDAPSTAPVDAVIEAAPPDAKKDARPVQIAEKKYGTLTVAARPVMKVFVGSTFHGETFATIRLKVGRHNVTLKNIDAGLEAHKTVVIEENKTTQLNYPW